MNNKGFTLIELISSVVILALVLAIAVPSIGNVSSSIRKSQRKNVISEIEIAAAKYAFDTGKTLIFADELITNGYMESDDEAGNINDPMGEGRLNCYLVEMTKKGKYYKAEFKDDKNYDTNGICDLNKLDELDDEVNIQITGTKTGDWYSGNVSLKAVSNTVNLNCSQNKCLWTSSGGANFEDTLEIKLNNVIGLLNARYTFQMTSYQDNTTIKRYTKSINVQIDNEKPIIYTNEIKVTDRFILNDKKEVTISASDGKGSGIKGYFLGNKNTVSTCSSSLSYQNSPTFTVTKKGTYIVCVQDKVGNIGSYDNLVIDYLRN